MTPSAKAKLRRKLQRGLVSVAVALTNEAKQRATRHLNLGERRNSITHIELPQGGVLWGLPGNIKNVALERGFRPHFVPFRTAPNLAVWASRVGHPSVRGRGKRLTRLAAGIYIGGPGSTLDYAIGGATGVRRIGRRSVTGTWITKGEPSKYLDKGKVGSPVLRWVIGERLKAVAPEAFVRGYRRG
jgi:hypothetical protein